MADLWGQKQLQSGRTWSATTACCDSGCMRSAAREPRVVGGRRLAIGTDPKLDMIVINTRSTCRHNTAPSAAAASVGVCMHAAHV
jgi:hypothetical protein